MSAGQTETGFQDDVMNGVARHISRPTTNRLLFLGTFLVAWLMLDRLVTSPLNVLSATAALIAAASVLVIGQRAMGVALRDVPRSLGLGRPVMRAVVVAGIVGSAFFLCLLLGARAVGVTLELRENWPAVLLASLIFHGLAEELVWRGFVFGHFRRTTTFWRAVAKSVPLIALTHVPIVVSNGLAVGLLATFTAAVTCLPFAYLWERGGGTVWAPALLHGLIGTWQLFERTYPDSFSMVVLTASIVVPMAVFLFRDRFFRPAVGRPARRPPAAGSLELEGGSS
jgi:membrane protease YdiL (CAAX protease family)